MSEEIIMGIDPGTIVTGYGIIKHKQNIEVLDYGCIKPPKEELLSKRYLIIFNSLESLIKKFLPTVIAVETQFVNKNVQSAIKLGMARGMAILAATKNNIPIFEYAPKRAKLAITGNGMSTKAQVQKMVALLLKIQTSLPEDAADSLSIAICHAHNISSYKILNKEMRNV